MKKQEQFELLKREYELWVEENIRPLYKSNKTKSYYDYKLKFENEHIKFQAPLNSRIDTQKRMMKGFEELANKSNICLGYVFVNLLRKFVKNGKFIDDTTVEDFFRTAFEDYREVRIERVYLWYKELSYDAGIDVHFSYSGDIIKYSKDFKKDKLKKSIGMIFLRALERYNKIEYNKKQLKFEIVRLNPFDIKICVLNTF